MNRCFHYFLFVFSLTNILSSAPVLADAIENRVRVSSEVIVNRQTSVRPIPAYVINATKCIASMKIVKAGLIWGGEGSTGLVSCKTDQNHWSSPSFFTVDGVNFGAQIGVQFMESVLLFMTDEARRILEQGTFELGADLNFAAGPVGGGGGVGVIPEAQVLTYDRTVGLYAGATVKGMFVGHDRPRNSKVYGENKTPREILASPGATSPAVVQPLVGTLEKYFPLAD